MNDTLLYNGGLDFLQNLLERYFSENVITENKENYKIFLPKFQYKNLELFSMFPVYNLEDNTYKLVAWINFNITKNSFVSITLDNSNAYNEELKNIDYEMIRGEIEKYYNIVILEINTNRLEEYPDLLESEKNNIKNLLEEYNEEIKKFEFAEYQEKHTEENIENFEKEKCISDYEYALKMLEAHNSEKKKYEFEWNEPSGLKNASDKVLDTAYRFIKYGGIKLSLDEKNQINIYSNIAWLCDNNTTTDELYNAFVDSNSSINERKIICEKTSTFSCLPTKIEAVCRECKFEKCPKKYAGYVLYLYNNGLLEKALEERKKYREENEHNDYFNFVWKTNDGLKKVSKTIFDFAMALCDNGVIWIDRISVNNKLKIHSYYSCQDYRNLNNNIEDIDLEDLNKRKKSNNHTSLTRNLNSDMKVCAAYNNCRLGGCPFIVAGYIYYLKTLGNEQQIIDDRKFYDDNKEKIELEIQEELQKIIQEELEDEKRNTASFNEYKDEVENIENLFDMINSPYQRSFHCAITCKDKREREIFANKIKEELVNKEKIICRHKGRMYTYISLKNFSARTLYFSSGYIWANQDDTNVLKNKDEYWTCDGNGRYIRETDAVIKLEILKNHLYIIDEISEFIRDYQYVKTLTSNNLQRKQVERTIDILTNLEDNNYLIILGTEAEMDALFALDSRFKFVYQDSLFKIKEMPIKEMFDLYAGLLKSELLEEIRNNKSEIEKRFTNYVSLNKEFIPLSNREIAAYLANYTNKKDKIELPENIYKRETVDEALSSIIGLESVKNKLKDFEKYMLFQIRAKANGMNIASSNMHMIFTGNPGTGKTTIARIMAKMLYDLGMIKENKLVEVERKDLVAKYIGQTATQTSEVIEKALGGVLFIDEAYSLAKEKDNYGSEAIATLIKAMEDKKDQLVVIFAGYKDEMKTFLDSNAGIASRIGYTFDFPDYTPDELVKIFKVKISKMGFELDEESGVELKNICEYFSKRKAFGNGRFIDKLVQETIIKHSQDENCEVTKITSKDIPSIVELTASKNDSLINAQKALDSLVGLENLKAKVNEFTKYIQFIKDAQAEGVNIPNPNMHMIFTGNPGTGKTKVARIMAKLLFDMGYIHENKLVEVERKDLIGKYIGETAPKTAEVIEKAMGGVLFIDEAYSLSSNSSNDYGSEAIATLIKAMEDHKGEFVVIFAGYKKEMGKFMELNSGIASRIGYTFDFTDYEAKDLEEIFYKKIAELGLQIEEEAKENLHNLMQYFESVENFGNGRFVDKVLQNTLLKMAENRKENLIMILKEHIPTIKEMTDTFLGGKEMVDPSKISQESLKKTAAHEVGHATISYLLNNELGIKKITIKAEGMGTLGYVSYKDKDEYIIYKKSYILNRIKTCLAGMVAEDIYFGEHANGNTSDLEKASNLAYNMITKYGMSDLGYAYIKNPGGEIAKLVFGEQNKILKACYDETYELIKNNKSKMDLVVEYLLDKGEITEEEFKKIFNKNNEIIVDKDLI